MKWSLIIEPKVEASLRKFPPETKRYVRQAILDLSQDPKNGKVLQDELGGCYSFEVKRFRVIYKIDRELATVAVIGIGRRETSYEEMAREF